MAFKFRLEKVAQHRQRLVDDQGLEVAQANRVVVSLESRIAAVEEDITAQVSGLADETEAVISVQGMISRTMWVSHLEKMRDEFSLELHHAGLELDNQREKLTSLWRELEVLNKLREQQKAAWQAEQLRRENLDLDEIGQIRADRQRRSKVAC